LRKESFEYWYNQMKLGNQEAIEMILIGTIPLIRYIVREDYCFPLINQDLENIAKMAVLKALNTYDVNKGNFNFYVSNYIHWDINKYLSRQEKKWEYLDSLERDMSDDGKRELTLHDIVYDKSLPSIEEKVEVIMEKEALRKALTILPPLDKYVMELKYGFITGKPLTFQQISDLLNYSSPGFFCRIVKRSLFRISQYLETGIITEEEQKNIRLNYLYDLDQAEKNILFERLKPKERIIMDLYLTKAFLNGGQIARKTGISHTHVKRLIKTSIEKLNS
jgi:RNA polymerase sigma factor (sigma-70 family)